LKNDTIYSRNNRHVLILLGNGEVANVVLKDTKGNNSGWIVITAAWAFAVLLVAVAGP
jgi:glycerol uptake facilitator protein